MAAGPACSGCPRKRHSAGSSSDLSAFVVITHPFHPLRGQRVEVLFSRRRGGQVVLACESAGLGRVTVLESWTDRVASPAEGEGRTAQGSATANAPSNSQVTPESRRSTTPRSRNSSRHDHWQTFSTYHPIRNLLPDLLRLDEAHRKVTHLVFRRTECRFTVALHKGEDMHAWFRNKAGAANG
jgi:hypothetical protein